MTVILIVWVLIGPASISRGFSIHDRGFATVELCEEYRNVYGNNVSNYTCRPFPIFGEKKP